MRRTLKFLHSIAAIGMTGALAAHIILLAVSPEPSSLEAYAAMREGIAAITRYLLLPSLTLVLFTGLLALGMHTPFHNAGWAWVKAAMGLWIFQGTLKGIEGPAKQAAMVSARALQEEIDPQILQDLMRTEWGSLWVILALAVANVAIAIWRPRLGRKPAPAAHSRQEQR
jgi:hypothetical protein